MSNTESQKLIPVPDKAIKSICPICKGVRSFSHPGIVLCKGTRECLQELVKEINNQGTVWI